MEHIGIDLGTRDSQVCVRNSAGEIVEEARRPTRELGPWLATRPSARVILETCTEAFRLAGIARQHGHDVRVVAATLVRSLGVGQRGLKNDERDARTLSEASCRIDLPSVHIPTVASQEVKAICVSREALVRMRTLLVNRVRSYLRSRIGHALRATPDTLPGKVRQAVPAEKSVLVGTVDVAGDHGIRFSATMSVLLSLLLTLRSCARSRAVLQLEVLALRHQLQVLHRSRPQRLRLAQPDRLLWVWLSRVWNEWRAALVIVKPETVLVWHRRAFRAFWRWKSRRRMGRPSVSPDVRALIRTLSAANPRWGAPRIHGELLKLGIDVSQGTVAKYMVRRRQPPSQTWRTFLANHRAQLVAADFVVVPTATCGLLFVLVILAHERRRIVHVAVTAHPTAAWTAQQLREAFPWDQAPRYVLHDRDHAFDGWTDTAKTMGMDDLLTAPRSPWQNAYVERFIGTVRRECLDHVIVFNATGLQRLMQRYTAYYERSRTHLSLDKDAPIPRPIEPPSEGRIVAIPQVGGLHHRYERHAA